MKQLPSSPGLARSGFLLLNGGARQRWEEAAGAGRKVREIKGPANVYVRQPVRYIAKHKGREERAR